jgi:hypothetical protein
METLWRSVRCNGVDVNLKSPLHMGTGEAITGCELILASDAK